MKIRTIYFFFTLVLSSSVFAQSGPRYLLVEHFTNTRCSLCPGRNANLIAKLDANPGKLHHISYHPSVPYNNCVLYTHNTAGNGSRQSLYNIQFTPQSYLWGDKLYQGADLLPNTTLAQSLGQNAAMGIRVEELTVGMNRGVTAHLRTYDSLPAGDYRVFVAIVEKDLAYNAPNSETMHHDVFRTMLPSDDGMMFTPAPIGETTTLSFSYSLNSDWNEDEIYAVVFVQDMNTNTVVNSGTKFDLSLQMSAVPANDQGGSASALVMGGYPPYTYKWNDANGQVSATATGLAAGLYQVTVTDSTGTMMTDTVRVESTVGIADPLLQERIKIYPNPARKYVQIDLREISFTRADISFYTINGKKILDRSSVLAGEKMVTIDVESLPAGPIAVLVKVDGKHATRIISVEKF